MTQHELQQVLDRIPPKWGQYIDCGSGWYPLIKQLDEALAVLDPTYVVHQVKQKFGGLRYYFEPSPGIDSVYAGAMRLAASAAEEKSFKICEETGAPGVLMRRKGGFWMRTLDPTRFGGEWEVVEREDTWNFARMTDRSHDETVERLTAENERLKARVAWLSRAYHRLHAHRALYLAITQAAASENMALQEILRATIGPDPDYPEDGFTFRWPEFTDEQAALIRDIIAIGGETT